MTDVAIGTPFSSDEEWSGSLIRNHPSTQETPLRLVSSIPSRITEKMVLQHLLRLHLRGQYSEVQCGIVSGYIGTMQILGYDLVDYPAMKRAEIAADCSEGEEEQSYSFHSSTVVFERKS